MQHVAIHESRRRERRFDPRADAVRHRRVAQPLEHLLTREVEIGAFGERDADARQPYSDTERITTRFGSPFNAVSIGTVIEALDFLGGVARPLRGHSTTETGDTSG